MAGKVGVNNMPAIVQAPGPQESNVVMDVRWCPTDPVAESRTVLQSNLLQSTTDGEGGRAKRALAERRGSSGACAPNNINFGWLKEGLSSGRGWTSDETGFQTSARKYAISESWRLADVLVTKGWTGTDTWEEHGSSVCSITSISSMDDWKLGSWKSWQAWRPVDTPWIGPANPIPQVLHFRHELLK
jgi:hypothetical protein